MPTPPLVTLLIVLALAPLAQAQTDPFDGQFKSERVSITLTPNPDSPTTYTGTLAMGVKTYPITASARDLKLTGQFSDGKTQFPFTATFETGALILKSGTATYRLARGGANPLETRPGTQIAPGPAPTPKEIEQSLKLAKAYLYSIQKDGHWDLPQRGPEPKPDAQGGMSLTGIQNSSQWGGLSALVTYALLVAGDNPQDARLAGAIEFLKAADVKGTYALGCRLQVWTMLPGGRKKEAVELAKRDRDLLMLNQRTDDRCKPFFRYSGDGTGSDHSASQFAVLGMWAAEQAGAEVPAAFWKETEAAWLKSQNAATGGWTYSNTMGGRPPVTPSMTAAGVATLFITGDMLHAAAAPNAADCRGNVPHRAIDAGLAWITSNAAAVFDNAEFPFYTLYGVERIGLASGRKYLGAIDWYKQGAANLLAAQAADGSWGTSVSDTAFAVLFLARGRAPLLLNKLQYDIEAKNEKPKEANWNQRPRDAANLARWVGRQLEREVRWQIVDLKGPPEDLHDAPILYIAGNQTLAFSPADEQKLRQFALQGGLILGNADCANPLFATSFKRLAAKLFPPYEMRDLPPGHLIYEQNYPRSRWKLPPQVMGLSNGARELMVLLPTADAARFLQTAAHAGHESSHELLADVFLYCTAGAAPRLKGDSWLVTPDPAVTATKTLKVARLRHDSNWNPEPAGWPRLAAILHNEHQLDLTIDTVKLGDNKLGQGGKNGYALAHLTTTGKFKLADAARAELKAYLASGGTFLVDATAGESEAAASLEAELTTLAGTKPTLLPDPHPLLSHLGHPASELTFRPYTLKRTSPNLKGSRLRATIVNARPQILFSPDDLSVGLVGHTVDGIYGYSPASATNIVTSILLHLAEQ